VTSGRHSAQLIDAERPHAERAVIESELQLIIESWRLDLDNAAQPSIQSYTLLAFYQ